MQKGKFTVFVLMTFGTLFFLNCLIYAQNIRVDNFEQYPNTDSLKLIWKSFGFSTLDLSAIRDTVKSPIGIHYIKYTYSGNSQTTWGGAIEKADLAAAPLKLKGMAGIQFYLKGDGTKNVIYLRLSNGDNNWSSNKISLKDTTWHAVRIPFKVDSSNGFSNGSATLAQFEKDLAKITSLRIYIDHPAIDNIPYSIYFDEIYVSKYLAPTNSVMLEDYETYKTTDELKIAWQFFGYSTLDYNIKKDPIAAPFGFNYINYMYIGDNNTTWGGAMRTKNLPSTDLSAVKGGLLFYLKGDGTSNPFQFRFYSGNEMWASYNMSLKDTNWNLVKIPFKVDTLSGFRYIGNNPDDPQFTSEIGTIEKLRTDLKTVSQIRFYVNKPVIDFTKYIINIDGLYAVNEFPPLLPVTADDFESYASDDALKTNWQQFGDAIDGYSLTSNTDSVANGVKAMAFSYKAGAGATSASARKRNIIPGINFSQLSKGLQFWLKGDGSSNKIIFRFNNGNEMWASYPISLSSKEWKHIGINFAADTLKGFRYLGNDPVNPIWSSNIGTNDQLYGDLANIDQIRFDIREPAPDNIKYTIVIDDIIGVDEYNSDITDIKYNYLSSNPSSYRLNQNYPNPFNPSTVIRYSLPQSGLVSLKVYDVLGQQVAVLLNSEQSAGTHEINFNASKLSSGIYFYTIHAGNFISTKKMLLLK